MRCIYSSLSSSVKRKNKIDSLNGKVDDEENNNRIQLDKIKDDITDAYAEGKITEQHYNLLKEKIVNFSDTGQPSSTSLPSQKITKYTSDEKGTTSI
jgi:hypothetical protein